MVPETGNLLKHEIIMEQKPSKTFRLDLDRGIFSGMTDGLEAVRQTIACILNVNRYENLIYSWNYGTELNRLFGKPIPYVKSELKRVIREALMMDSRIREVSGFEFKTEGRNVLVSFHVKTMFGELDTQKEVSV